MVAMRNTPSMTASAGEMGTVADMMVSSTRRSAGRKLNAVETATANLIGGQVVINATLLRIEHRLAAIQWLLTAGLVAGLLKMFGVF